MSSMQSTSAYDVISISDDVINVCAVTSSIYAQVMSIVTSESYKTGTGNNIISHNPFVMGIKFFVLIPMCFLL